MPQERDTQQGLLTLVALGSNAPTLAGDSQQTIKAALTALGEKFGAFSVSRLYETPAFPAGAGPDFVNAACAFRTRQSPQVVLDALHAIEADFDRERTVRWGQRTLDLDLIAQGQQVLPDATSHDIWRNLSVAQQATQAPDQLILPHPRLQDRAFVLVPLADIAPDWSHPVLGQTVAQMRDALPASDLSDVVPIG